MKSRKIMGISVMNLCLVPDFGSGGGGFEAENLL